MRTFDSPGLRPGGGRLNFCVRGTPPHLRTGEVGGGGGGGGGGMFNESGRQKLGR